MLRGCHLLCTYVCEYRGVNSLLRVSVLGPIELVVAGGPVRPAGQKQRALLAALLLEHGKAVSVDRLVDTLWGADPPPTARAKVHTHVSGLRQALRRCGGDEEWILTRPPGYLLRTDDVGSDLAEFDGLTAAGRAAAASGDKAAAAEQYARALALWRGPAFADVTSPVIQAAAAGLDERRVLTIEARAQANLDVGRCDVAIADLSTALTAYPLRERLRGFTMLALYRLGCRADALRLYRDGYKLLADELGLEPGPQLRHLHQRILTGDPAL
jgi:DNA-binding SARP family transcriptional activator